MGICDILIIGGSVVAIEKNIDFDQLRLFQNSLRVIDASGSLVLPGLVDQHIHFNGAGGEGGPQFRTPPLPISSFALAGITTAVGLLGTDGVSRALIELLAKARGLEIEGISTWIFSGSYMLPGATLTEDIVSDLILIDKVIGLKIAVSDHRSSHPDTNTLRDQISRCYLGGILSGKSGVIMIHIGSEETGFSPFIDAVKKTDIPIKQLIPTHCNRSQKVLEEAIRFGLSGGFVDITTSLAEPNIEYTEALAPSKAVKILLEEGVPLERITLSTDSNGSLPVFNNSMELVDIGMGSPGTLWNSVVDLIREEDFAIENAIKLCTITPSSHLGLKGKGFLGLGSSGDAIIASPETFKIKDVISRGNILMQDGEIKKYSFFEKQNY
jgi:beta-aspartyl-dipeptidase (metallo-type)